MTAYNISSYAGLKTIKDDLAGDYTLTADINASDSEEENAYAGGYYGFEPIGTVATPFTGTFDGGGFTISNLYINRSATQYVGLFGVVTKADGFIKDVRFANANITASDIAGILAGQINGTSGHPNLISDCVVDGTVSSTTITGGLVGWSTYSTFTDCSSSITLTSAAAYGPFGGLIGYAASVICTTCYSTGTIDVSGTTSGGCYFGGFIGQTYSLSCTFTSCYSTVSVIDDVITSGAGVSYDGGFVGYDGTGTYTYCHAIGLVVSTNTYSVSIGGFAGWLDGNASQCAALGDVNCNTASGASTSSSVGGFAGQIVTSTVANCYAQGDVCKTGIGNPTNGFRVGGFVGAFGATITITNSYSTGYVFPTATRSGGFAGYDGNDAVSMTTCYWDKTTSGMATSYVAGGVANGKTTAEMKTLATFTGWNFTTIWDLLSYTLGATDPSTLTIWPSATGDYDKFLEGTKDADSFQTDIPSTNDIRWIDSQEALLIGTAGDEWKLASNKLDTPLSPTNHGAKRQSGYGSAYMQAINVNEVIIFVDFVKRKVREMSFNQTTEKYICPDMTALSEHITAGQIKWMAYQKNPDSILWVGLETGDVLGFVYDREQNVTAWFKVLLGGDAVCQSGCVIPGETEDEVYLVVNRTITGSTVYAGEDEVHVGDDLVVKGGGDKVYLERFAAREFTLKADAFFVDCGVSFDTPGADVDYEVYAGSNPIYSGTDQVVMAVFDSTAPVSAITGLDHLEGETVKVLGDGVVADDAVVSEGEVTVKIGGVETAVSKAQVGKSYTSKLQPMRLVLGDSMGKKTRVNKLVISLLDTGAAKYGPDDDNMHDIDLAEVGLTNTSEITGLFTGETEVSQAAGFDPLNPIIISSDKPLPLTVRCIVADIDRTG